jgi:hypothetical protein
MGFEDIFIPTQLLLGNLLGHFPQFLTHSLNHIAARLIGPCGLHAEQPIVPEVHVVAVSAVEVVVPVEHLLAGARVHPFPRA